MPLLPPTRVQGQNRSRLADWLELSALVAFSGSVSSTSLRKLIGANSDSDDHGQMTDPATGEIIEREILEPDSDDAISRTYEEIEYRYRLCGDAYPFEVEYDDGGNVYGGYYRLKRKFESEVKATDPYIFYLLGLLETGIRDGLVSVQRPATTHYELGRLFQIAACLAMGGYLRGDIVWFGFPRLERDAFLPALTRAFQRIGSHKVLEKVPPGYPQHLKDAGVDILGWLDFADGRGSECLFSGKWHPDMIGHTRLCLVACRNFPTGFSPLPQRTSSRHS
jgi:hypothetical protein